MTQFVLDANLRQFATDKQWEQLSAWETHGGTRAAAEALGVNKSVMPQALKAVRKKAARAGYMPDSVAFGQPSPPGVQVPDGFVLKGQSAFVGPDGGMRSRWDKTKQAGMEADDAVRLVGPKTITKISTMYDQDGNVTAQWVAEKPEAVQQAQEWEVFAKELAAEYAKPLPVSAMLPAPLAGEQLMVGYPVGDHHLGMLAWKHETGASYDIDIAQQLLLSATDHLVSKSPDAGIGLVCFMGDFMHYDSFEPVTPTSRNMLDSDGRFPKMVRVAIKTMRYLIEAAARKHAHVHVIVEIGNHDLASSIFLMECLDNIYENYPNITIDTSPKHYHYYRFGQVLIGTHHGHGTKFEGLPLIMANDRAEDWGQTTHRYIWTGHIHSSQKLRQKDFPGAEVESFRVLAAQDAWAANKGYRSKRDMKAIVFHKDFGEVERRTVNPQMLVSRDTGLGM